MAFRKARQLLHRQGLVQLQALRADRQGLDAQRRQLLLVLRNGLMPGVDPQRHGGGLLCQGQQPLPILRVVFLQALDPPTRVVPLGWQIAVGLMDQIFAFAHEAAQTSVDEATLRLRLPVLARGLDGLVHQGEDRIRRIGVLPAQRQSSAQQGVYRRWRRFGGQTFAQCGGAAQLPEHLKTQGLNARAQRVRHGVQLRGQRAALARGLNGAGGGLQQAPQRGRLPR